RCSRKLWAVGRQSGNWDLRPGCSVSTNTRLVGTVHEFESTRSQMDSITMATAIRSKKWKATASPGVKLEKLGPGHVADAGDWLAQIVVDSVGLNRNMILS